MSAENQQPSPAEKSTEGIGDDDYSDCNSYIGFKDMMDDLCGKYTSLNPKDGKLFALLRKPDRPDLDETGMEFIRGGIVAVVSAWESYVQDLFKEAFDILIKIGSGQQPSLENLSKIWPGCRPIIEELLKKKAKRTSAEAVAYEILSRSEDEGTEKVWIELLHKHCESVLERKTLLPVFSRSNEHGKLTIDELFKQLFKSNKKAEKGTEKEIMLSEMLIGIGGFNYSVRIQPTPHIYTSVNLEQVDASDKSAIAALCNISRLYYGLRCTLVHGKHEKTLEGALRGFPESVSEFPLPLTIQPKRSSEIKEYYIRLYEWTRDYGRTVWVNYLTFLNITRFYKAAAYFLMLAVAKWLCETLNARDGVNVKIWRFNPDRQREVSQPSQPQS